MKSLLMTWENQTPDIPTNPIPGLFHACCSLDVAGAVVMNLLFMNESAVLIWKLASGMILAGSGIFSAM